MIRRIWKSMRRAIAANQRRLDRQCFFRVLADTAPDKENAKDAILWHMNHDAAWNEWITADGREELAGKYAERMVR